jgi:hypothetical protein
VFVITINDVWFLVAYCLNVLMHTVCIRTFRPLSGNAFNPNPEPLSLLEDSPTYSLHTVTKILTIFLGAALVS